MAPTPQFPRILARTRHHVRHGGLSLLRLRPAVSKKDRVRQPKPGELPRIAHQQT